MAVPMGSVAQAVTLGGFNRCTTSFRVAGMALHDIPTCFITCQKSLCVFVAGATLWRPPLSFCVAAAVL